MAKHQPKRPRKPASRRISLRALARELGVVHTSLAVAVRDGRLTSGVGFDARGRVVVTDAVAAAANWRAVHVPQVIELAKKSAARAAEQAVDDYTAMAVASVLVALVIRRDDRDAAIAELRGRFERELVAFTVDDDTRAGTAFLDVAIADAVEYLDELDEEARQP